MGVSTIIGFAGEVLLYSMEESKGKPFKVQLPSLGQSMKLLGFIFVTGIVTDYAVKFADKKTMSTEELSLAELYEVEKQKIKDGVIKNAKPLPIVWSSIV